MTYDFTFQDRDGNTLDAELFVNDVSQGTSSGGTISYVSPSPGTVDLNFKAVPTTGTYYDWEGYVPALVDINALETGNVELTITFIDVADFVPYVSFYMTQVRCYADIFVMQTTGGPAATYEWNWGDGSALGSGAFATHTYTGDGNYTVNLEVTVCDDTASDPAQPCPCPPPSVYSTGPVDPCPVVVTTVSTFTVPITDVDLGWCCEDETIPLTIWANGADVGTTFGPLALVTLSIDKNTTQIVFTADSASPDNTAGYYNNRFTIRGKHLTKSQCNDFAIPMIFAFSTYFTGSSPC